MTVDINSTTSIITLNINTLTLQLKGRDHYAKFKSKAQLYALHKECIITIKDIQVESKRTEKKNYICNYISQAFYS